MDSNSIIDLKNSKWYPFKRTAEEELLNAVPTLPGVYVIRWNRRFGRLRGESDIVYIGQASSGNGLKRRIRGYLHTTPERRTSYRVMSWAEKLGDFEIAFIIVENKEDAPKKEIELLREYEIEHAELPPLNRQGDKI